MKCLTEVGCESDSHNYEEASHTPRCAAGPRRSYTVSSDAYGLDVALQDLNLPIELKTENLILRS